MKIETLYSHFLICSGISIDSRTIEKGSIFFALKGEHFNGNKFAQNAIEQGASLAIIDDEAYFINEQTVLVEDVLSYLQSLANHHRKQLNIPVIAITGTNGKTTTKELTHAVLSQKYKCTATKGNLNNHIGVPLTLLSIDKYTEIAIIEMGANHQSEIADLCKIAMPNFGLITNIGRAHLEGFGSYDGVIQAKNELYSYMQLHDGSVFYHNDDDLLAKLSKNLSRVSYGSSEQADCKGKIIDDSDFLKMEYQQQLIKTQLVGAYNFVNAMAAACIGSYFQVKEQHIINAIQDYQPQNNRSQYLKKGTNRIILDAYNANPSSMMASIKSFLNKKTKKQKLLILGNMAELGVHSESEHQKIVEYLARQENIKTIFVGQNFLEFKKDFSCFAFYVSTSDAKASIKKQTLEHNFILIKGSRTMQLENILEVI